MNDFKILGISEKVRASVITRMWPLNIRDASHSLETVIIRVADIY